MENLAKVQYRKGKRNGPSWIYGESIFLFHWPITSFFLLDMFLPYVVDVPLCSFIGRFLSFSYAMIWWYRNKRCCTFFFPLTTEKSCSTYCYLNESCKNGSSLRSELHHFPSFNISRDWARECEGPRCSDWLWGLRLASGPPGCWSCLLSVTFFLLYTHRYHPETGCREVIRLKLKWPRWIKRLKFNY